MNLIIWSCQPLYQLDRRPVKVCKECLDISLSSNSLSVAQQRVGGLFLSNAPQLQSLYHSFASSHPNSISVLTQHK